MWTLTKSEGRFLAYALSLLSPAWRAPTAGVTIVDRLLSVRFGGAGLHGGQHTAWLSHHLEGLRRAIKLGSAVLTSEQIGQITLILLSATFSRLWLRGDVQVGGAGQRNGGQCTADRRACL